MIHTLKYVFDYEMQDKGVKREMHLYNLVKSPLNVIHHSPTGNGTG